MLFTGRYIQYIYGDKCFMRPAMHLCRKMFAYGKKLLLMRKDLAAPLFLSPTAATITSVDFLI